MLVRFTWKRTLLAVALVLGAVVAVSRPNEAHLVDALTIYGQFKGRNVMLTATNRSAGAIESLQWGGMEFLDASDHGRHLQSAVSFDGLTECDNPTEAGSSRDGSGPSSSSSRLLSASVAGNLLRTRSQMAYWLRLGQKSPDCGYAKNDLPTVVSSTTLAKTVRFLPGHGNVLEHRITFGLARPRARAQFEALTAYMPIRFGTFYRFDPATDRMEPLSDGPGEQAWPVILATDDGMHALGLFTPQTAGAGLAGPGYGRWRFAWARVTKSNVVFRLRNAAAGPHRFLVYTAFGTLDDVRSSLIRLYSDSRSKVAQSDAEPATGPATGVLARN
jgi:hypothetical protein